MANRPFKRSMISDVQVLAAYALARQHRAGPWPYEILSIATGAPEKVTYAACERAEDRGLLDCGVSLRSGWITPKGHALLEQALKEQE